MRTSWIWIQIRVLKFIVIMMFAASAAGKPAVRPRDRLEDAPEPECRHLVSPASGRSDRYLIRPALPDGTGLSSCRSGTGVLISDSTCVDPVRTSRRSADAVRKVFLVLSGSRTDSEALRLLDVAAGIFQSGSESGARLQSFRILPDSGGIGGTPSGFCVPLMTGCIEPSDSESVLARVISESSGSSGNCDIVLVSDGLTGDQTRFSRLSPSETVDWELGARAEVEKLCSSLRKSGCALFVLPLPWSDAAGLARLKFLASSAGGLFSCGLMGSHAGTGSFERQAAECAAVVSGGTEVVVDRTSGSKVRFMFGSPGQCDITVDGGDMPVSSGGRSGALAVWIGAVAGILAAVAAAVAKRGKRWAKS